MEPTSSKLKSPNNIKYTIERIRELYEENGLCFIDNEYHGSNTKHGIGYKDSDMLVWEKVIPYDSNNI